MFPEKLLYLQVSILFCILTNAHSLHVQTIGGGGSNGLFQSASNSHRPQGIDGLQDMDVVDSNRLSNVNRISFSPLLMLPVRHQIPMLHQQNPSPSVNVPFTSTHNANSQRLQEEGEEEQDTLLQDLVADSSRIANHRPGSELFGEMRVLGNSRYRTPHYGTLSTSTTDESTGVDERHGEESQRHHMAMGKQVPYKHQEQFLKQKPHHISGMAAATNEHKAALRSNDLPGENLWLLKKRTEEDKLASASARNSSSGSKSEAQQSTRLNGQAAEASAGSADKDHRILVSKKSGHPFMDDAASMIPHSIASQLMLRSARGQRQYDVPQIGKCTIRLGE